MNGKKYKVAARQMELRVNGGMEAESFKPDLEAETVSTRRKPPFYKSVRYYVIILALASPFVSTFSKVIINFALIDMIDPEFVKTESAKLSDKNTLNGSLILESERLFFETDNSCPTDPSTRDRLIVEMNQDIKRAKQSAGEKFAWDTFEQGLLKAAYPIGHALVQVPCGRLSEIYGSHWVMSMAALLTGICCFMAPYLAAIHFNLLFADLLTLGLLGSSMTPALLTLFTHWLTKGEKEFTFPFYLITSRLGYAISSVLCGLLMDAELSWRYVFFTAGAVSSIWSILFMVCARSRPIEHPLVSNLELDYLVSKNNLVKESVELSELRKEKKAKATIEPGQSQADATKVPEKRQQINAPWIKILTSGPVWAFIVTKFCVKFSADTVSVELPTYLKRVMHFSAKDNGLLNGWNYVIFCFGCLSIGTFAKVVIKQAPFGVRKTFIRKLFQSIASFGVSLCLVGVALSVCEGSWSRVYLFSLFFITTFGTGGEAQIPLDITDRYTGTVHALASSIAISGAIEPTIVGLLLRGRSADVEGWKTVWLGAAFISFLGGVIFLIFADANIQPFNSINKEDFEPKGDVSVKDKTANDGGASDKKVDTLTEVVSLNKLPFNESKEI